VYAGAKEDKPKDAPSPRGKPVRLYLKASRLAVFTITRFIVIGHCDSVTCVTFLSSFFIIYYRAMDMCAIAMWTSFIFKYDPGKLAK